MDKKRILIIEDQAESIKCAFDFANRLNFENTLEFKYIPRSQDVDFQNLMDYYDLIFVDITLADKFELNGFGVLSRIIKENLFPMERIILTGNSKIKEGLSDNQLPENIKIVYKPVTFKQMSLVLKEKL